MIIDKLTLFQWIILKITFKTLKSIYVTGNQWRAADRLWIDGGNNGDVWIARKARLIEPEGREGYVLIGSPHDMVKLTDLGLECVKQMSKEG